MQPRLGASSSFTDRKMLTKRGGSRPTWRCRSYSRGSAILRDYQTVRPKIAFVEADPRAGRLAILTKGMLPALACSLRDNHHDFGFLGDCALRLVL
jgi:hypothetical protein